MPKCKYCNVELEFDNILDEYTDASEVVIKVSGHCPKCKRNYRWIDIYVYSFTNLEEG